MTSRANWFSLCPGTCGWPASAWKGPHIERREFDFLAVQCGVTLQNFFDAGTLIQHIGNQFHGDSRATIDRRTAHCLLVFNNNALRPLKPFEPLVQFLAHGLYLDQ